MLIQLVSLRDVFPPLKLSFQFFKVVTQFCFNVLHYVPVFSFLKIIISIF